MKERKYIKFIIKEYSWINNFVLISFAMIK